MTSRPTAGTPIGTVTIPLLLGRGEGLPAQDGTVEVPVVTGEPRIELGTPLSAAYCAQQAAALLHQAATDAGPRESARLTLVAQGWRELAVAMATYYPLVPAVRGEGDE